jgi:toxin ParE1/3/4
MPRIIRTPQAKQDVAEIWLYIAERNFPAAEALLEEFDRALKLLASVPGVGTARDDLSPGLRSYPVGNYLILFRKARGGIEVARIMHGARNLRRSFRRRKK